MISTVRRRQPELGAMQYDGELLTAEAIVRWLNAGRGAPLAWCNEARLCVVQGSERHWQTFTEGAWLVLRLMRDGTIDIHYGDDFEKLYEILEPSDLAVDARREVERLTVLGNEMSDALEHYAVPRAIEARAAWANRGKP